MGSVETVAFALVIGCPIIGLIAALIFFLQTRKIEIDPSRDHNLNSKTSEIVHIVDAISEGAYSFLFREYLYMFFFIVAFSAVIVILVGTSQGGAWMDAVLTMVSFVVGAVTSILSGFIGMAIAVYANGRTAVKCAESLNAGFVTAFKAGSVMGQSLVALGVFVLFGLLLVLNAHFAFESSPDSAKRMFECAAGYGLGGSAIAMFARVGGGIYTKAADVGADLVGKLEAGIPEDDPRNPAVIADNVGDNVGDIAGMGADLFGSFAEATCAAMVLTSTLDPTQSPFTWALFLFPVLVVGTGIVTSLAIAMFALYRRIQYEKDVEHALKMQLWGTTLLQTVVIFVLAFSILPNHIVFSADPEKMVFWWAVSIAICTGLWSGLFIGICTEYFTSNSYGPVREVANACKSGAATNVIYGLALGYKSVIVPVFCLCATIYVNHSLCGMYGIAMGALGILSTMSCGLAIDAYGPIADNAGGIAEMAHMDHSVRDTTDVLDAAGNTTAAIGKGFAIGSAALVSLALFGAFVSQSSVFGGANGGAPVVNLLNPMEFAGLLLGAMIPYWFSAMTMKSVGKAALAMVEEVRRQFREDSGILSGESRPDYKRCIQVSTDASLSEMIAPGCLVIGTPLVVGLFFGPRALAGLLAGSLVSSVQLAISASNTGGAWDNAKKYIEKGNLEGHPKGSEAHKAAVVGDTIGDPLKDTSGPALNIVMKLMAILSLVFVHVFPERGWLHLG